MKFDLIIGNPPYQDKKDNGGNNKIYNLFAKKALNDIKSNGTVAMVTPTSVTKDSKRFTLLNQKGFKRIDFDANKYFKVGVNICYWIIDMSYKDDVVIKSNNKLTTSSIYKPIYDLSKISSYHINIYEKIMSLTKNQANSNKRMFKRNNHGSAFSNIKSKDHKHEIYSVARGKVNKTYTKRTPVYVNDKKLIIANTKALNKDNIIISNKNYGPSYFAIKIDNNDQVDNILSFVLSPYFIKLYQVFRDIRGGMNSVLIDYCPIFDKNKLWSDDEVKEFFEKL